MHTFFCSFSLSFFRSPFLSSRVTTPCYDHAIPPPSRLASPRVPFDLIFAFPFLCLLKRRPRLAGSVFCTCCLLAFLVSRALFTGCMHALFPPSLPIPCFHIVCPHFCIYDLAANGPATRRYQQDVTQHVDLQEPTCCPKKNKLDGEGRKKITGRKKYSTKMMVRT